MIEDNEYLSTLVQASFQLTNTAQPKLKQPVLKDCVTVGLSHAEVEGVLYDLAELPSNWYFKYKSIANDRNPESKLKRISIDNGQVNFIPLLENLIFLQLKKSIFLNHSCHQLNCIYLNLNLFLLSTRCIIFLIPNILLLTNGNMKIIIL